MYLKVQTAHGTPYYTKMYIEVWEPAATFFKNSPPFFDLDPLSESYTITTEEPKLEFLFLLS